MEFHSNVITYSNIEWRLHPYASAARIAAFRKEEASMNFKKEAAMWVGAVVVGLAVLVVSWDWLETQKPAPPEEISVGTDSAGQEAFGDSD